MKTLCLLVSLVGAALAQTANDPLILHLRPSSATATNASTKEIVYFAVKVTLSPWEPSLPPEYSYRARDFFFAPYGLGACSAMSVRLHHKVPVLREGFRQQQLVSLVESAIKPRARILLVAGEYFSLSDFLLSYVSTFELDVESNGEDGLRRYRERGPYDIVLAGFSRIPSYLPRNRQSVGMNECDLARAIRRENPEQRIAMITGKTSPTVMRSVQRKLGDIPLLRAEELLDAVKELRYEGQASEGEILLASVDRSIAKKQKRIRKTAKLTTSAEESSIRPACSRNPLGCTSPSCSNGTGGSCPIARSETM